MFKSLANKMEEGFFLYLNIDLLKNNIFEHCKQKEISSSNRKFLYSINELFEDVNWIKNVSKVRKEKILEIEKVPLKFA